MGNKRFFSLLLRAPPDHICECTSHRRFFSTHISTFYVSPFAQRLCNESGLEIFGEGNVIIPDKVPHMSSALQLHCWMRMLFPLRVEGPEFEL